MKDYTLTAYGKNYHTGEVFIKQYKGRSVSGCRLSLLNDYIRKSKQAKDGQVARVAVVYGADCNQDCDEVLKYNPSAVTYDV